METYIAKDLRGNWTAETFAPLWDDYVLQIRTSKNSNKLLATSVSVCQKGDGWVKHTMRKDMYVHAISEAVRVTEKAVIAQHQNTTREMDDWIVLAHKFYNKVMPAV